MILNNENIISGFEKYISLERNYSPLTTYSYISDVTEYVKYAEECLSESFVISANDKDMIRAFMSSLMDKGLKATYVNRKLAAIKSFYKYALKIGLIDRNPAYMIRGPKQEKPLPVYVPTREVINIIDSEIDENDAISVRNRLIIAILYECGLRRSEVASLFDKDVDIQTKQLKVLGKGSKFRIVPFGDSLKQMIIDWRTKRNNIKFGYCETFFITLKGEPMKPYDVYMVVHKALEDVPNLSRRGAHALRHSFATDMMGQGADLLSIKELMGHSSINTTVRYTHTSFKQLQHMYNAHPRAQNNVCIMDIRIKALHFDATEQLKEFIEKKINKLSRFSDDIQSVEVTMKVVKPEVSNNKEVGIKVLLDGTDLYVDKIADSFEEAVDLSVDVIKRQLEKRKEQKKNIHI